MFWRWLVLGAAAPVVPFLLWSCNSHPLQKPDPRPVGELMQYREINAIHKVDIVFAIDDSGSMREEQDNLARNFNIFMQELAGIPGADLQIGVVTSDLGAGAGSANTACNTAGGDKGVFCTVGGVDRCAMCGVDAARGRFLRTINPNFTGPIANTFSCMASVGTNGCGFEHSLGGLRSSLVAQENAGFIRDDAYLAFVLITDEDDCTAPPSSQMFATPTPGQDWSLRCALQAHTCGGRHNSGAEDVNVGIEQCQAAADGELVPLNDLVNSVIDVKKDPNLIIAAGIFGWPLPEAVGSARYQITSPRGGFGERGIRPICESNNGSATPAYRVKAFVEAFPNHSTFSICQNDFREAMRRIGEKIRVVLGSPCVDAPLIDVRTGDRLAPGATSDRADCAVIERRPSGNGVDEILLPRCAGNDDKPCWNLVGDNACSASRYKIEIDRKGEQVPEGTQQTIRCLTQAMR